MKEADLFEACDAAPTTTRDAAYGLCAAAIPNGLFTAMRSHDSTMEVQRPFATAPSEPLLALLIRILRYGEMNGCFSKYRNVFCLRSEWPLPALPTVALATAAQLERAQ